MKIPRELPRMGCPPQDRRNGLLIKTKQKLSFLSYSVNDSELLVNLAVPMPKTFTTSFFYHVLVTQPADTICVRSRIYHEKDVGPEMTFS